MIVALLNQPHGVGKMTLALHPAGLWSYRTRHVTVIDADPQGRTLEWSEMRAQERLPSRFTVIGLTRNTLHRDAQNIACDVDRVIVDGLCHIAALARGAADVDLVLVPVRLPRSSVRLSLRHSGSSTRRIPFGRSSVLGSFSIAAMCTQSMPVRLHERSPNLIRRC